MAVVPLRIAMGVQNKILEALAMGCKTLCTSQAATGLQGGDSAPVVIADAPTEMTEEVMKHLRSVIDDSGHREEARRYVLQHYDWQVNLRRFAQLDV